MIEQAEMIRKRMNQCGGKRIPFLFGTDFEMSEGFLIENPLEQAEIPFAIGDLTNLKEGWIPKPAGRPGLEILHSDYPGYQKKFRIIHEGLMRGNSFLANLTEKTPIRTSLTLEQIFIQSQARYKLLIPGKLVCFSPECFVRITNGKICSYPMKGTIDATISGAEQLLLSNHKELCEHNTIVDLIRNDLSTVASQVRVERFRYIEKIKTFRGEILQTSSEITGRLSGDYSARLGDILFGLLPAGSISGAPKPATIGLIRKAEKHPRGFYTGVFGYFNGINLDSAVMIRYIEKEGENYYFRSGGGITAQSNPEEEYREILQKIYLPISQ